jgi:hypothetical protein
MFQASGSAGPGLLSKAAALAGAMETGSRSQACTMSLDLEAISGGQDGVGIERQL